ncbi:uncharacterized protein LOC62_07G009765 [Vanrija pseudolonga]|uniref:AB hydrolase-1 domain-containing protein n=1 Tax=Vanrija pseudolonga TaxID=143232 RepID=A0AAF0YJ85_9TREE|nr:hypothetical protein LOC62_07G009765 [Vanrija pseudolonga]
MVGLCLSYKYLFWTRRVGEPRPLADGIERTWLPTPSGELELLSAGAGASAGSASPPILFVHGGMGSAWVWTDFMLFLAAHGIRSYAISLRGHGDSWAPGYLRMVYLTPRRAFEDDLVSAVEAVQAAHGDVVLVGHSAGGGLSQAVLAQGRVNVLGLALVDAIPGYGSATVNANWMALDRWFVFRLLFCHFGHPNSALSHPLLTLRAFFGSKFPLERVYPFQDHMARYESLQWPFSMLRSFAPAQDVLAHVKGKRVLVLAGDEDALMTPEVTRQTAAYYALGGGVTTEFVGGAGHHLQNDVQWEEGAARLLEWYRAL